jgi:hypothetical protein
VAQYRYLSSSVLTGQIMGDWLPLTVQSCARNLNSVGTLTGALNLTAGSDAENRAWIAAVEPERSLLWVFQDAAPAWAGIIWDWPHQSIVDGTLPLSASTPESLFSKRQISDTLTFTDADIFDIFRALAQYALAKTPNGQMAGLTMGTNQAGITATITYNATDLKKVYDAWTDLVSAYGFEYSIRPAVDPDGNYYLSLDLGYPELGLPLATSLLAFSFGGGGNLIDYRYPRTGSTSSNRIVATASASDSLAPLNSNSDFENGVAPWTGINGAPAPVIATDWSASGTNSVAFHGNGSTSNPAIQSEACPVTGGSAYSLAASLNSVLGWATTQLSIVWLDSTGAAISTVSCAAVAIAAATPGSAALSASAPSNAVSARALVQMTGHPSASVIMEADDVILSPATPTASNWQSQLPHGQDNAALAAGFPLLEDSVSLSTVGVTQQAQIDDYADGILPSVTGTQTSPLLILAGGRRPAVTEIVLGSYCQFTATSTLHPANPDGSPGLQVIARITGWSLYPPSGGQQQETTQIQLGAVEVIT